MAEACQAGFYFNRRTEECRSCDLVCGDQYGGRQQLECTETCPGYGISTTTLAPAEPDSNEKIMWIVIGLSLGLLFIIAFVVVMYFRKKMGCLSKQPKTNTRVQEESKEGLVAVSAPTYA